MNLATCKVCFSAVENGFEVCGHCVLQNAIEGRSELRIIQQDTNNKAMNANLNNDDDDNDDDNNDGNDDQGLLFFLHVV